MALGRQPTNQIKVELQLLQDDNIRLLQDFADDWNDGVDRLAQEVQKVFKARVGETTVAAGGDSASTPAKVKEAMEAAGSSVSRQAGSGVEQPFNASEIPVGARRAARAAERQAAGASSIAPPGGQRGGLLAPITGIFGPEHRDALGVMIGQQLGQRMDADPMTSMMIGGLIGSKSANWGLGRTAGAAGIAMGLSQMSQGAGLQAAFNFGPGGALPGAQLGYSAEGGILGSAIGTEAWKYNIGAQMEAYKRSRAGTLSEIPGAGGVLDKLPFGVGGFLGGLGLPDLMYGRGQAGEAMELTRQYGWGDTADQDIMLDTMERFSKKYAGAIPQEFMMQLMEPAARFGTGTYEGAASALDLVASAAKDAHMNLTTFSEKIEQAAAQLESEGGMNKQQATVAAAAFTAATGLSPEKGVPMMTSQTGAILSAATSGRSLYDTMFGRYAGGNQMQGSLMMLGEFGKGEYWQSIKDDPAKLEAAQEFITMMWMSDPQILGGMDPQEFQTMMLAGGDPAARMKGIEHITQAGDRKDVPMGLQMAGVRKSTVDAFRQWVGGGSKKDLPKEWQNFIEKNDLKAGKISDVKRLGNKILGNQRKTQKKDVQKFVITVDPKYDHIFGFKEGKSESNSKPSFSRVAKGIARDAGEYAYDMLTPLDDMTGGLLPEINPFDNPFSD